MKISLAPIAVFVVLIWLVGCGEDTPTEKPDIEPIKTGISDTTYLNVEYGFKITNLPSSGWVSCTREYKDGDVETVLLMAFASEDICTFEEVKLEDEENKLVAAGIPYVRVTVLGPYPDLPTKPDLAKEVMNNTIALWELLGIEVTSRQPVAGVNTTGYAATISLSIEDSIWMGKTAFFAKHEHGYYIIFWAPEDKYSGLIAHIDPMIASFELLGL